jgi:hypothetical protein
MGCDVYETSRFVGILSEWRDSCAIFSETDRPEDEGCLCTWPNNYGEKLSSGVVRKLAMLGAAVVLMHHGETDDDTFHIPGDLPVWFLKELDRVLPREG